MEKLQDNQGSQDEILRPRPLPLFPLLRQRNSIQNQNSGDDEAAAATKSRLKSKSSRDPRGRRDAICDMLMPAEYFAALPQLELLIARYQSEDESDEE